VAAEPIPAAVVEAPVAPAPEVPAAPAPTPVEPAPTPGSGTYAIADPARNLQSSPVLVGTEEAFFSGPGIWIGEPPRSDGHRNALRVWATRVGTALVALVVTVVLLISIGPKFLPYQTFFVRSGSMHPTFDTGDVIMLAKTDASDLKVGDIITFDRPDKPGTLVTHRIVSIETTADGKQFSTKGDANSSADPWKVPAFGTGWKYQVRIPKLGFFFGSLGTKQARFALLAIPALLLGLLSIIDIWKPRPEARGRR
jgi:signal peptidase